MGREPSGRGGRRRFHGRIHGKGEAGNGPVGTTRMELKDPTKQTLSSSTQNSKMPCLTLSQ